MREVGDHVEARALTEDATRHERLEGGEDLLALGRMIVHAVAQLAERPREVGARHRIEEDRQQLHDRARERVEVAHDVLGAIEVGRRAVRHGGLRYHDACPSRLHPASRAARFVVARALSTTARVEWAVLLRRTCGGDALRCPKCAARMRVLATITDPSVVMKILSHLGLRTEPLSQARARAPAGQESFNFDAA